MSELKVITVWQRFNEKTEKWEHNHISDGYSDSEEFPAPKAKEQEKNWPKAKWRKFKAHLDGMKVIMEEV